MAESIRTFIACHIPAQVRSGIGRVQEALKAYRFNIKWVRPESIHLTLKFLGNIDPRAVGPIGDALSATVEPFGPFSIQAKGLGVFPGIKRPRVIWIGINGQIDRLIDLQRSLDENLAAIGYPQEKRPFKGHLTLGRAKGRIDTGRMRDALTNHTDFEAEPFTVGSLILYKSDLHPTGAVYTKLLDVAI